MPRSEKSRKVSVLRNWKEENAVTRSTPVKRYASRTGWRRVLANTPRTAAKKMMIASSVIPGILNIGYVLIVLCRRISGIFIRNAGKRLGDVLVAKGKIKEEDLLRLQAYILGIPFVNLENQKIDPEVLAISLSTLEDFHAFEGHAA